MEATWHYCNNNNTTYVAITTDIITTTRSKQYTVTTTTTYNHQNSHQNKTTAAPHAHACMHLDGRDFNAGLICRSTDFWFELSGRINALLVCCDLVFLLIQVRPKLRESLHHMIINKVHIMYVHTSTRSHDVNQAHQCLSHDMDRPTLPLTWHGHTHLASHMAWTHPPCLSHDMDTPTLPLT